MAVVPSTAVICDTTLLFMRCHLLIVSKSESSRTASNSAVKYVNGLIYNTEINHYLSNHLLV